MHKGVWGTIAFEQVYSRPPDGGTLNMLWSAMSNQSLSGMHDVQHRVAPTSAKQCRGHVMLHIMHARQRLIPHSGSGDMMTRKRACNLIFMARHGGQCVQQDHANNV